ncbi:MAG TPA: hypothetical protein VFA43_13200 [Gemmatimonadaceae bacterium]|nr:hypothetical protein [Gemmatimonadaceae bacterium]
MSVAFLASCGGTSTAPQTHPAIGLATTTIVFGAQLAGGNPTAQTVNVTNSGTGTLSGLALGTITYAGGGSGWLNATLSTTSAPATITLNATTGSLAQGTYTATIPVNASSASNPANLKVRFIVFPPAGNTTLSVGGDTTFLGTPVTATNIVLQPGQQYLIAVINTDTSASVNEDFTLFGSMTSTQRVRQASLPTAHLAAAATRPTPSLTLSAAAVKRMQRLHNLQANHMAMLDHNIAVGQRFARTGRSAQISGGAVSRPRFSVSQTVGTVNKIYVASSFGAGCTGVDSIGARTVAVGAHVIVLADTNTTKWPSAQRDSAFYQTFANEYDAVTWPHINTYIGNPLAYDNQLSSIGKITVVISPVLNDFGGGIVAFVNSCDFFPFDGNLSDQNADLGNQTEVFYYWAPDSASGWVGKAWEDLMRGTASHETKHIVSYTDRKINSNFATFEERWLEEGLAQESADIWERNFNGTTWKGHANFNQTVACELYLGPNESPACQDANNTKPVALTGSHLPFLFDYLAAESQSATGLGFGNTGANATPTNYGAGWEFARWATDQYASTEASFIQSLVNEPTLSGLANVSAHSGKSIEELLVYWNLASAIFDTATYTAADPRITVPSFNFGQIFYVGQTSLTCNGNPCGLFGANFSTTPTWPITPTPLAAGNINVKVTGVSGTTAKYFLLSASGSGNQYIQLQDGSGNSISTSSGLRVGIIRVQ